MLAYALETMVRLLEPFAPHMGAELWEMMGARGHLGRALAGGRRALPGRPTRWSWPCRSTARCATGWRSPKTLGERRAAAAKALPGVMKYLEGKEVVKEVVVPGRLVNLVVR